MEFINILQTIDKHIHRVYPIYCLIAGNRSSTKYKMLYGYLNAVVDWVDGPDADSLHKLRSNGMD